MDLHAFNKKSAFKKTYVLGGDPELMGRVRPAHPARRAPTLPTRSPAHSPPPVPPTPTHSPTRSPPPGPLTAARPARRRKLPSATYVAEAAPPLQRYHWRTAGLEGPLGPPHKRPSNSQLFWYSRVSGHSGRKCEIVGLFRGFRGSTTNVG